MLASRLAPGGRPRGVTALLATVTLLAAACGGSTATTAPAASSAATTAPTPAAARARAGALAGGAPAPPRGGARGGGGPRHVDGAVTCGLHGPAGDHQVLDLGRPAGDHQPEGDRGCVPRSQPGDHRRRGRLR